MRCARSVVGMCSIDSGDRFKSRTLAMCAMLTKSIASR
jgi:hypothetical protein